jgi:type II secretory pathway pseudopilin PulG
MLEPRKRRQRTTTKNAQERGFTVIELTIAAALALVVMAVALMGVVEGQRDINTAVARNADANAAQSTLNEIGIAVHSAGTNSVVAIDSTGTQLWVYDPNGFVPTGNPNAPLSSSCVVWEFTNGALVRTTGGAGTPLPAGADVVQGAGEWNGSAVFQAVPAYSGLVDIDLTVQRATSQNANSAQAASSASRIEAEVQDPAMRSAVQTATTDVPNGNCYP